MEKTVKEIIRILEQTGDVKAYALIGGLAVGGWITPRATRDIDILADLAEGRQLSGHRRCFKAFNRS